MLTKINKLQAASLLLGFASTGASAADITISERDADSAVVISISGEIVDGDEDTFRTLARKAPNAIVNLNSPGGSINPAMEIGRIIWFNGMSTFVQNAECASACGLIWLAGYPRAISTNGKVGFHAVYSKASKYQIRESSSGNALVGAYIGSLKFGSKIVEYATAEPSSSMKWLNEADAKLLDLDVLFLDRRYKAEDDFEEGIQRVVKSNGQADKMAVSLYTNAARLGFAGAQNNLGDLYENGNGVTKNKLAAVFWYTKAAERGEPTAYLSLSSIFAEDSDPDILVQALQFAILAHKNLPEGRNKNASLEIIRSVTDRLPASSRMIALELAEKWSPLYQETSLLSDDPVP